MEVLHQVEFKMAGELYNLTVREEFNVEATYPVIHYAATTRRTGVAITITFTYPISGITLTQKSVFLQSSVARLMDPTTCEHVALVPYDYRDSGILFQKLKIELFICFKNLEAEHFRKAHRRRKREQ
jgi:hypothetical protein